MYVLSGASTYKSVGGIGPTDPSNAEVDHKRLMSPEGSLNRYHHHGRFSHAGQGKIIPHPPPYTYPHPGLPTTGPTVMNNQTLLHHFTPVLDTTLSSTPAQTPQHHHDVPLPNETMPSMKGS